MVKNHWYWLEVKIWFFSLILLCQSIQCFNIPPSPPAPHGHLTIICAQEVDIWKKKAFSRVGYLSLTWVRQGIWTRIVKSSYWNKMSFIFFDKECGNLNKPIFRNSNAQWGYQGRGVWRWSLILIDIFYWKALRESFPRATKETMYKSLWSHKGLKPNHLSY